MFYFNLNTFLTTGFRCSKILLFDQVWKSGSDCILPDLVSKVGLGDYHPKKTISGCCFTSCCGCSSSSVVIVVVLAGVIVVLDVMIVVVLAVVIVVVLAVALVVAVVLWM